MSWIKLLFPLLYSVLFGFAFAEGEGGDPPEEEKPGETPKPDGETPEGNKEKSGDDLQSELERIRAALKVANAESADRRKKLEKYEKEERERQEAEMSELQKAQTKLTEMQTQYEDLQLSLQTERIKNAILQEAGKLNFDSPEDAYLILDLSDVEVTDGKVKGFEKQLKALAESGRLKMRSQTPPDIDADKKGKKKTTDDEAIMRRFGL